MMRSKKLCAVLVDTLGREIMIKRPCTIGPDGWPQHAEPFRVSAGGQLMLTTRDVPASPMVLPVTYPQLHEMVAPGDNIYIGRWVLWCL
jgi:pyruvate kinase